MNILVLATDAFGGYGGIATYNQKLLQAICSHSPSTKVTCLPRAIKHKIKTENTPANLRFNHRSANGKIAFFVEMLKAIYSNQRPELIICAHINLLPLAFVASTLTKKPIVLIMHGIEAWNCPKKWYGSFGVNKIKYFISVSDFTRERFLKWSQLHNTESFVLPNSIDLKRYYPDKVTESFIDKWKLRNKKIILTVARISAAERRKGFDEVIEILPDLVRKDPQIIYMIVGDGDDIARLKLKAQRLGVQDNLLFTGYVSEADKIEFYRAAHVYVMPSRGEGFGIVYLEAMACELTVVGSKADASSEVLRNGEWGYVVDPGNPEDIQRTILRALSHPKKVSSIEISQYSYESFESKGHEILAEILAEVQH